MPHIRVFKVLTNRTLFALYFRLDGDSVYLRLSAADGARIDPRAVRARFVWWALVLVTGDLDVPRPLLERVLKCLLVRGAQSLLTSQS